MILVIDVVHDSAVRVPALAGAEVDAHPRTGDLVAGAVPADRNDELPFSDRDVDGGRS